MLVGRAGERARIGELILAARAGTGGALVLEGEAGIGKSALLDWASAEAHGFTVLATCAAELEAELPFAALSDLLGPVLGLRGRLPTPQRAALEMALKLRSASALDRFAAYSGVLGLLATAVADRPVLVLVDDAHWLDAASAEALAFVARRARDAGVALLVAVRPTEVGPALGSVQARVPVGGLGLADAGALLRDRGLAVAESTLPRLLASTGGNPLALLEVAALLSVRQRQGREPLPEPVPSGRSAGALFGSRLDALGDEAALALTVLAASGSGDLSEVVAALRELGVPRDRLQEAEAAGLVRVHGDAVRFCHPLARSLAYYRAPAHRRRAAHRALGAGATGPEGTARRAWHLAAAALGPDDAVADDLERAAVEARGRGAPVASGMAFERAARLSGSAERAAGRLLAAAHEFHLAGDPQRALAVLEDGAARSADPRVRAGFARLRALVESLRRPPRDVKRELLEEVRRVEGVDALLAAQMRVDAAWLAIFAGQLHEALELARAAHARCATEGGAPALLATHTLAAVLLLVGAAREGDALLMAVEPLLYDDEALAAGHIVTSVAHFSLFTPRAADSRAVLRELVARWREAGALSVLPSALTALADMEFRLGDWTRAYAAGIETVALAEETGQHGELAHSLLRLAQVEAAQGREADCRQHVEHARAIAERHGTESLIVLADWVQGLLELSLGRLADAVAPLERARRMSAAHGVRDPLATPASADLVEVLVRLADREAARAVLEDLQADARATGRAPNLAIAARCLGLLAAPSDSDRAFDDALHWHDLAPSFPFERARTCLLRGERLRRNRRRIDARTWLTEARTSFERLGARPWAERAAAELTATGERARRRQPSTREQLTPQELLVAVTVAEGASNREAAATLFLSPKTIEAHLGRVYRKLGIRSRVQLTRVVLGGDLATGSSAPHSRATEGFPGSEGDGPIRTIAP